MGVYIHRYAEHASLKNPYGDENVMNIPIELIMGELSKRVPDMANIKARFKQTAKNLGKNDLKKFFKEFGEELEKRFEETTLKDTSYLYSSSQIESKSGQSVQKITTDLKKNIQNLEATIKALDNYLKEIEDFTNSKHYSSLKWNAFLASYEGGMDFLNKYTDIKNLRASFKESGIVATKNESIQGRYSSILAQKKILEQMIKQAKNSGAKQLNETQAGNIQHAISSVIVQSASLSGNLMELLKTQEIEKILPEVIDSVFGKNSMSETTVTQVGAKATQKEGDIVSTSKSDIKITLKPNGAQLSVDIPISVKATSHSFKDGKGEISIQSGTPVRNVLQALAISEDGIICQGILNLILWGGYGKGSNYSYSASDRKNTLDLMRKANVVNALAGNLRGKDFAYYLVVNNKVFSIYDLLQKILTADNNNPINYLTGSISNAGLTKLRTPTDEDRNNWDSKNQEYKEILLKAHFDTKLKMNIFNGMV